MGLQVRHFAKTDGLLTCCASRETACDILIEVAMHPTNRSSKFLLRMRMGFRRPFISCDGICEQRAFQTKTLHRMICVALMQAAICLTWAAALIRVQPTL